MTAVLGSEEVFSVVAPGTHGSTYGGNPLACVVMMETLKQMEELKVVENSKNQGDKILK